MAHPLFQWRAQALLVTVTVSNKSYQLMSTALWYLIQQKQLQRSQVSDLVLTFTMLAIVLHLTEQGPEIDGGYREILDFSL